MFRSTALGLAGGSGSVVLTYDLRTNSPRIVWSGHHTQSLAFGRPLLVLDMYEHSYAIGYGGAAKCARSTAVDAFFDNIQWDAVSQR